MELYLIGESIECNKCEVFARKIVPSALQIDDILGRHMKYNCSQNSEAEVIEESNPKVFRLKKTSNLDLGDRLKADAITILTNQLKPVKPEVIKHSHRHQAMKAIFNKYTFAEIKYSIEQISKAIEKRKGK